MARLASPSNEIIETYGWEALQAVLINKAHLRDATYLTNLANAARQKGYGVAEYALGCAQGTRDYTKLTWLLTAVLELRGSPFDPARG